MAGECNVYCLRFITKCTVLFDDTFSSFVVTDEVSGNEKDKKKSLTIFSGYKKIGSDSDRIGGGSTCSGVHNTPFRKQELYRVSHYLPNPAVL